MSAIGMAGRSSLGYTAFMGKAGVQTRAAKRRGRPTAKTESPAEAAPRIGRPRGGKSSNPDYHALTVYVPLALHRAVKSRLVAEGAGELSNLVASLLADWLKAQSNTR